MRGEKHLGEWKVGDLDFFSFFWGKKKLSISPRLLFAGRGLFSLPVWGRNNHQFIRSHEYKVIFFSLSKLLPEPQGFHCEVGVRCSTLPHIPSMNLSDAICLPDNRPVITNRLPENSHKNQEPLSEALFGFGTLGNPPKINRVLTMQTHVLHFVFPLTTSRQALFESSTGSEFKDCRNENRRVLNNLMTAVALFDSCL